MLSNANLCEASYNVIIYEIRVKKMFKDIKKDNAKTLIKINNYIYLKIIINKIK